MTSELNRNLKHGTISIESITITNEYLKASTPELVDLKITDYCSIGCDFCYQGSTEKGKHANLDIIKSIIIELAEHQVFEIAIGGGEPTCHPDFLEILQFTKKYFIVPNFTTRSLHWIQHGYHKDILPLIGKVGFSTNNQEDIEDLAAWTRINKIQDKFVVHIVLGIHRLRDVELMLESLVHHSIPVLFLDYKKVGRGKDFKKSRYLSYEWFPDLLKKKMDDRDLTVSIDTPLAKRFQEELEKIEINKLLLTIEEGKFSCYIDAVNQTISRSSYQTEDAIYLGNLPKGGWINEFRKF